MMEGLGILYASIGFFIAMRFNTEEDVDFPAALGLGVIWPIVIIIEAWWYLDDQRKTRKEKK